MSVEEQKNYWLFNDTKDEFTLVERDRICASELLTVCLNIEPIRQTGVDRKRVLDIVRKMSDYSFIKTIRFGAVYGRTSGFIKQK